MFGESRGFDPVTATSASRAGDSSQMNAIFDSLLYQDLATGNVYPQIATSMTSSDALVWVLKVRPNIKFSDGTAFDAAAVKATWQRHADPANTSGSLGAMQAVQSMDVVDGLTLRVTLKAANGQFPRVVSERLTYIASPAAVAAKGSGFGNSPVGAGPFLFKDWVRDSQLTLVRNPSYWNAPLPYLDQIVVKQIPDNEQRYNTLKTGGADFVESGTDPTYTKRAKDDGFATNTFVPSGGLGVVFNESRPPFNDIRVRKAIALVFDLNGLNQAVYSGTAPLPTTFFTEQSPFYDASLVRTEATGPNLSQAQALIDQYGKEVKFTFMTSTAVRTPFEYLQALVNKLKGVTASLEVVTPVQVVPRETAGDYDAGVQGFTAFDPEPLLYDQLHTGSPFNLGRYSNTDMDKALETGRSTLDPNVRKQAYRTAQQLMINDVPQAYFSRFVQSDLYNRKIQALEHSNVGPMWDRMWLK
jgi:peptide/nickel transport system substrate-binding protein